MGNTIDVKYGEIPTIASQVSAGYNNLQTKLEEIDGKAKAIDQFWKSAETERFVQEFNKVFQSFEKFNEQYTKFMSSLEIMAAYYEAEEAAMLSAMRNGQ